MGQPPLVSILIPTFNSGLTVGDAIQSCCEQTYQNLEILVYDEASNDNTREIIAHWAQRDSRIRVLTSDKNSGPVRAWRVLLQAAKGKYSTFVWADDLILPQYVEKLSAILEANPTHLSAGCTPLTGTITPPQHRSARFLLASHPLPSQMGEGQGEGRTTAPLSAPPSPAQAGEGRGEGSIPKPVGMPALQAFCASPDAHPPERQIPSGSPASPLPSATSSPLPSKMGEGQGEGPTFAPPTSPIQDSAFLIPHSTLPYPFQTSLLKGDEYALGIMAGVFPVTQICSLFHTAAAREIFDHYIDFPNPFGFDFSRRAYGNDVSFLSELALRSGEVIQTGEPLVVCRASPDSMTVNATAHHKWQFWFQYVYAIRAAWTRCRHLSPRMDKLIQIADDRANLIQTIYLLDRKKWPTGFNPIKCLRAAWFLVRHDRRLNKNITPAHITNYLADWHRSTRMSPSPIEDGRGPG